MSKDYKVQSIIFDKSKINLYDAVQWLIDHNYSTAKGVDETATQFRFRQLEPYYVRRAGFTEYRTKPLDDIISLILAYKA
jgi:hypothetical protein